MADSFKWIANKTFYPASPPLIPEDTTLGLGFDGWPRSVNDLDVSNYEVVNTYNLKDLVPFFWNWRGFTANAEAKIPLTTNSAEKEDVELEIGDIHTSFNEPKDRIGGVGFAVGRVSSGDMFDLEDLEDGIENPEYDPNSPPGPGNEYWLREPNEVAQCKATVSYRFRGINTIYRCYSGGVFIGYSFKDIAYVYAKSSMTGGGDIDAFNQKLIGYYGLIEDIDDLIYSYDNNVDANMQALANVVTNSTTLNNGNTSISVTKLESTANYTNPKYNNTPEGDESAIIGIDGELDVNASLGFFTYHSY